MQIYIYAVNHAITLNTVNCWIKPKPGKLNQIFMTMLYANLAN